MEGDDQQDQLSCYELEEIIPDKDRNLIEILKRFSNKKSSRVKKDYLLLSLFRNVIRSHKKIPKNQVPSKTSIRISPKDDAQNKLWEILTKIFYSDEEFFRNLSKNLPKNFKNSDYINFFSNEKLAESFFVIIDLLSLDKTNFDTLSKNFHIYCCNQSSNHTLECEQKWDDLIQGLKSLKSLNSLCGKN